MKLRKTMREFIDKNGNTWTWEETAETIEALKKLHKNSAESKLNAPPTKPTK